jgi:hypothetical protein
MPTQHSQQLIHATCSESFAAQALSVTNPALHCIASHMHLLLLRSWRRCCEPCAPDNKQEASCTPFIDYGLLEFRPTGGCPRSCCADGCTAPVRVNGRDTTATGICAGHFVEMRGNDRRRSLLQAGGADELVMTPVAGSDELLTEVPADVIFLNDDGTVLKVNNATASSSSSSSSSPGRRLLSRDDDDHHDDGDCPRDYYSSGRDCAVGGCGKCCIKSSPPRP